MGTPYKVLQHVEDTGGWVGGSDAQSMCQLVKCDFRSNSGSHQSTAWIHNPSSSRVWQLFTYSILFFQIQENVTRRLLTLESESTLTFETTDLFIAVEEMQESGVCLISSHLEEKSMGSKRLEQIF